MGTVRHSFGKTRRLRKKAEFSAVFDRKRRAFIGPLGVYVLPNGLPQARLGISMSRRVGTAARRNRIKRLLREAFRLQDWPALDIIVVPKPHDPLSLAQYMALLRQLVEKSTT